MSFWKRFNLPLINCVLWNYPILAVTLNFIRQVCLLARFPSSRSNPLDVPLGSLALLADCSHSTDAAVHSRWSSVSWVFVQSVLDGLHYCKYYLFNCIYSLCIWHKKVRCNFFDWPWVRHFQINKQCFKIALFAF